MEDSSPETRLIVRQDENVDHFKQRVWEESKKVWAIAFPAMVCRVTTYGAYVVSQASFGHIREVDLAAYALVQTILVRFANGILVSNLLAINITLHILQVFFCKL